ncbi:uncharacterized protein SRS1_25050 [Sporisorium reilianum f. sp. reilianum]|uniref:DDE Tnp4 domain-containing protein n=1 Tax=Sporisorium reilianum f. sp. reilianum TaxID=72559 RepID=A0A2N8U504_9BASI|nr:uncharacterized protein SRS1_25050 [Sporisorium reilianum f. sp. reilianum]
MGRHGNGASVWDIAHTLRVSIGSVILVWASKDEKIKSKAWVLARSGIPEWQNGFVMVDGTLVPLQFTLQLEGHFDRKKNYSLNVQLVILLHNLKIIEYMVGSPGSTHDSSAFARSDIFANPHHYLAKGEWIWADLGYRLLEHIVSPYRHSASLASEDFKQFNKALSNVRIRSEHAIGYLKGCFQALKGI